MGVTALIVIEVGVAVAAALVPLVYLMPRVVTMIVCGCLIVFVIGIIVVDLVFVVQVLLETLQVHSHKGPLSSSSNSRCLVIIVHMIVMVIAAALAIATVAFIVSAIPISIIVMVMVIMVMK